MERNLHFLLRGVACLAVALLPASSAQATDWPQFNGPDRNLITPDEAPGFPGGQLRVKWRVALLGQPGGASFSSMAVANGRVFTMSIKGCEALDANTGQLLWTGATNRIGHSTPSVCNGRVYVFDSMANLHCLDAANGNVIWAQAVSNYVTGFQPFSNLSQSPLVANDRVFVFASGQTDCVLAFSSISGDLLWKGQSCVMTHASPVLAEFCGVPQLLYQGGYSVGLISISPEDGHLLWNLPGSANYTTPLPCGQSLLALEQGRKLNVVLTNGSWGVTQAWANTLARTLYAQPVVCNDHLYAIAQGALKCVRLADGAVQWSTNGFGNGTVVLAGSRLVAVAESGWVNVVNENPQRYDLVTRCQPLTNNCLNLPAVVDGHIYVRNELGIACVETMPPVLGELTPKKPAGYSLTIRTADRSPLDAARVPRIGVRVAPALSTNAGAWTPFMWPRTFTNGILVYSNLPPPTLFFRILETNAP